MFAAGYKDSVKEKPYSSDLTAAQWVLIKELIRIAPTGRPIKIPLKDVIDGIFSIAKNGCKWADLPHDFPDYKRVNEWFTPRRDDGTWQRILDTPREGVRRASGRDPSPGEACVDSQTVKAAATGGGRGYDRGKKTNGRKRHIPVDTAGLLLAMVVTAGNVSDARGGRAVRGPGTDGVAAKDLRFRIGSDVLLEVVLAEVVHRNGIATPSSRPPPWRPSSRPATLPLHRRASAGASR